MSGKPKAGKDTEPNRAKRRKVATNASFGAPSEDDLPYASQFNTPSSSASCTRDVRHTLPPLTALCIRAFGSHLERLTREEYLEQHVQASLKFLPEPLREKLFAELKAYCPQRLSHGFISSLFLKGSSVSLSNDLPGVRQLTISALSGNESLRHLTLIGFAQYLDTLFANALRSLINLETLNLRGCTKVSGKTAEALASVKDMTSLNLSYTAVSPPHLAPLVKAYRNLAILKIASISNCTDKSIARFVDFMGEGILLPTLVTLKLRQNGISESSLTLLLRIFPHVRRLDVSFTLIHRMSKLGLPTCLEKLSLTSTPIEVPDLIPQLSKLTGLQIISLGALGSAGNNMASSAGFSSDMLHSLTDALETLSQLHSVSLVGNVNLGRFQMSKGQGSALSDFIIRVGRRCTYLNLARVTYLRSVDLSGLAGEPGGPTPQLQSLLLNNTGIDDDAIPFIGSCVHLEALEVAATKLTRDAVLSIISSCPKLARLDVTGCRGIRLADRRRMFELWGEEAENVDD